jgi:hypothetical protein
VKWRETMTDLNEVRNAVAHSDDVKLAVVKQKQPLNLATFKSGGDLSTVPHLTWTE